MTHTDFESGAVARTGAATNPTTPAARKAQGANEHSHQPADDAPTIVVDFAREPEFPEKPNSLRNRMAMLPRSKSFGPRCPPMWTATGSLRAPSPLASW